MGWGSHCPNCGKEDCSWSCGEYCDGNTRARLPMLKDTRLRFAASDFHSDGHYFYVERLKRGWIRSRWLEVEGTRSSTPDRAAALAVEILSPRYPST